MDESATDVRNGATWIRDYLLDAPAMARAADRLQTSCRLGIRHLSAIGIAVPLDQVKTVEVEIARLEENS